MRRVKIDIPIYKWELTIVTIYDKNDENGVKQLAEEFNLPGREELLQSVRNGSYDGGRTYTHREMRRLLVVIFPWSSEGSFVSTLNHEKRHVLDDIMAWHDIHDKEAVAYLDGWLSEEIYKLLNQLK